MLPSSFCEKVSNLCSAKEAQEVYPWASFLHSSLLLPPLIFTDYCWTGGLMRNTWKCMHAIMATVSVHVVQWFYGAEFASQSWHKNAHSHIQTASCGLRYDFFPQNIVLLQLLQVTTDSMIVSGRSVTCRRGHQHHPFLISTPAAPAIKRTTVKLLLSRLRLTVWLAVTRDLCNRARLTTSACAFTILLQNGWIWSFMKCLFIMLTKSSSKT